VVRAVGAGKPVATAALAGALLVATVIVVRLLVSLIGVTRRSRSRRERHRTLIDLLDRAERRPAHTVDGLRILDGALPLAYCVPGRAPRVVLSGGVLEVLDDAQIAAVLAHEQAHLRHRHEIVMESFTAFYRAVPPPLRSRAPLDAVHLLLEMVADDAASRRTGPATVRSALDRLSEPGGDGSADDWRRRLDRLAAPRARSVGLAAAVTAAALALLVLPTVILVVPWFHEAVSNWPL
jgi:hypothetical protein